MESVCCDLPAAYDETKTGYGFLKYRVVIADTDEFVTLRRVMANIDCSEFFLSGFLYFQRPLRILSHYISCAISCFNFG